MFRSTREKNLFYIFLQIKIDEEIVEARLFYDEKVMDMVLILDGNLEKSAKGLKKKQF